MVVWLSIQIQVDVGGFPVCSVPQGAIWSSVDVVNQEGKVAVWLSLHGELDVGMVVTEVVKDVIQLFGSMWPDHERIIYIMEPTHGLVGCLAE